MISREQYTPGPATGVQVKKEGDKWTLILVRELHHSPEKVWQALTDPAELREWAPRLRTLAGEAEQTQVFMNNCYGDFAQRNASQLIDLLGSENA